MYMTEFENPPFLEKHFWKISVSGSNNKNNLKTARVRNKVIAIVASAQALNVLKIYL